MEQSRPQPLPDRYFIKGGYRHREHPAYDDAVKVGARWQLGVYEEAKRLAEELEAKRIVDVGCGDARNLARFHPRFEVVGIDYGPNIESAREHYQFGTWIELDLEGDQALPVAPDVPPVAVLVCADVIEHLVHPDVLLAKLRQALDDALVLLISTPERDLYRGPSHNGPPPNKGHVREWTLDEFAALLTASGFVHGTVELVQSNDQSPEKKTILAKLWPHAARSSTGTAAANTV